MIKFLLPSAFCLLALVAFGQQFKAGLSAGLVTSQVDGDRFAGYNKAGLYAGGFVSTKLKPDGKWTALFEINYIQKGSRKVPHPDRGDYLDYKVALNYAEVPILLKYDFTVTDSAGGKKVPFSVIGGVAAGALVKSAEWDMYGPVSGGTPFQKTDISYVLGLSYFVSEHIGFEVRTQYSILPVRKGGTSAYYPNWITNIFKPGYYNNLLVFAAKYKF